MDKSAVLIDGHYQIALPWPHYPSEMPDNCNMAVSRMQSLGRRLERDSNLQVFYKAEIDAYVKRGYAREVATEDVRERGRVCYLLHHAVAHPAKPERVRVVFDCAVQQRGISLNIRPLQGPDYTNNLVGVLTRFRQEKIALVADIESMFNQVRVSPRDTDFLCFLWWQEGDPSKPLKKYKMLVHLFGATSLPSCAGIALRKTAEDNKEKYPEEVYRCWKTSMWMTILGLHLPRRMLSAL
ncbi:hypothetical protein HOLleu_25239 [Holothuria leucospilota]|uniref:Reverse transcriptase domain-containing protein n=1 Tax=Holothuria leucospilota TaxID=206669 RepID=A0A9Q1H1Q8_HOLLE|nr:hypothetical protein HOLleu_25239 [Holothuria leucospilota]